MPRKQLFPKHPKIPPPTPSPELEAILCELGSPEEKVRADAVRKLCPCRTSWDVPVQQHVWALRDDPSPVVRHAVEHDLTENPDWNERNEARKLLSRLVKEETLEVRREIETGWEEESVPPPHSLAWLQRPRRKSHKKHRLGR
jgi:hypothetical protein